MYTKVPSYLTVHRGGYYLKLPIPPDIRHHFPGPTGRPRTHLVESLKTSKESEAESFKRLRLAHYWAEFARLQGRPLAVPNSAAPMDPLDAAYRVASDIREALGETTSRDAVQGLQGAAQELAEGLAPVTGDEAAMEVYRVATSPGRLTLLESLKEWNEGAGVRESTKAKRELAVRELLSCLRVKDCLPEFVTEDRAVAYVSWLNKGKLGYSTKQDRISTLHVLWRFLSRRRLVPKNSSPWVDHDITGKTSVGDEGEVRGWWDDELVKLLSAPDTGSAKSHYRRPLFNDLYALGLLTGARLDSIVSLTPSAVKPMDAPEVGYLLTITNDKSAAGNRTIPVVHPVAVAILQRRLKAQKLKTGSLFPECRPGGKDNKLSHHVSKAMGRDRDTLGFGSETTFHSTRHNFFTQMDNSGQPVVHVQRYTGHAIATLMHGVYSDGSSLDNLVKVAKAIRYSKKVETALKVACG